MEGEKGKGNGSNEEGRGSGGMGNEEEVEPVYLNVIGAQESIPRNRFRQCMWPDGRVR
jgi:hypothetical protein